MSDEQNVISEDRIRTAMRPDRPDADAPTPGKGRSNQPPAEERGRKADQSRGTGAGPKQGESTTSG